MCGRYANSETIPAQAARFRAVVTPGTDAWEPTWNAAPTQRHPVVIQDASSRRIGLMSWGWPRSFATGGLLPNARGEEALGKPTYREALYRRRCIIPATVFYEWQERTTAPSIPHAVALRDRVLLGIAGVWESATDGTDRVGRFLLFTVPANAVVAPILHRMAAVLRPEDEALWLDPATDGPCAHKLLQPYPAEAMDAWRISTAVNSVRMDGPQLLDVAVGEPDRHPDPDIWSQPTDMPR